MLTEVTITYLEMRSQSQLQPSPASGLIIQEATIPCPELNRFFYAAIGGRWYWIDRRYWTYEQWAQYVQADHLRTWVAYMAGTPAGYYELSREGDGSVKIAYFGLLPQFIGQGHGGYLLTNAIQQAWAWDANRVWVHTNSLDGPYALRNYQSRGLTIYDKIRATVDLPEQSLGAW